MLLVNRRQFKRRQKLIWTNVRNVWFSFDFRKNYLDFHKGKVLGTRQGNFEECSIYDLSFAMQRSKIGLVLNVQTSKHNHCAKMNKTTTTTKLLTLMMLHGFSTTDLFMHSSKIFMGTFHNFPQLRKKALPTRRMECRSLGIFRRIAIFHWICKVS